jgi:hypothetical protein
LRDCSAGSRAIAVGVRPEQREFKGDGEFNSAAFAVRAAFGVGGIGCQFILRHERISKKN